jgi:hypothetical protein
MTTDFEEGGVEAVQAWAKEHVDRAVADLMKSGEVSGSMIEGRPAWAMPDRFVIGQVRDKHNLGGFIWIIAGDFKTDRIGSSVAATPRDAARHFALKWQLDAEKADGKDEELVKRAEDLYAMTEHNGAWDELENS